MASFPRTLLPVEVTSLAMPGPLISKTQSGKVHIRTTQQVRRTWTERYLLNTRSIDGRALLAAVDDYWRNGTIFTIDHRDHLTPLGVGGGSPLVDGASQTGSSLVVDAAPLSTTAWLRPGDIIGVGGLAMIFEVTAAVNTNGAGQATIPINPPIFTGGSPADNAAVTITAVTMNACILEPPQFPTTSGSSNDYGELVCRFSESL